MGRDPPIHVVQSMTHGKLILHESWVVQQYYPPWVMDCTTYCTTLYDPWSMESCHHCATHDSWEKVAEGAHLQAITTETSSKSHLCALTLRLYFNHSHTSAELASYSKKSTRGRPTPLERFIRPCNQLFLVNRPSVPFLSVPSPRPRSVTFS